MKQLILSAFIVMIVIVQPADAGRAQQQIKKDAQAKWPGDYTMQKFEIDKQTNALYKVKHYKNKKVPYKVLKEIKSNAKQKWPNDHVMQLYEIEKQTAAYVAIN